MDNKLFEQKWNKAKNKQGGEFSIFVPPGGTPQTQRQFNLYYYHKLISSLIDGKDYKNSIEFGCGRGTASLYLNLYSNFDVTMFDISEDGIDLARGNFELYDARGSFFVADSSNVPVPDNSFDLVVSMGLLEHLEDYSKTLREMYRVLRPGGTLITMNIPHKSSIQILNNVYLKFAKIFDRKKVIRKDYFRVKDQPIDFLKNAQAVGFSECKIIHTNPFPIFTPIPRVIDNTLALLYRGIMGARRLYRKEPMETGPKLSQCHFLIGKKL